MSAGYTTFRSKLGYMTGWVTLWSLALYLVGFVVPMTLVLLFIGELNEGLLCVMLGGAVLVVGLAVPSAAIMTYYLKVSVGPDDLRTYNFWGNFAAAEWDELTAARPINMFGARFLRLTRRGKMLRLWLPLDVTDLDGMSELIEAYAGEDHPVSAELRRWAELFAASARQNRKEDDE